MTSSQARARYPTRHITSNQSRARASYESSSDVPCCMSHHVTPRQVKSSQACAPYSRVASRQVKSGARTLLTSDAAAVSKSAPLTLHRRCDEPTCSHHHTTAGEPIQRQVRPDGRRARGQTCIHHTRGISSHQEYVSDTHTPGRINGVRKASGA